MTIRRGIIALGVSVALAVAVIASFGGASVANACCSGDPVAANENEMHISPVGIPVTAVGGHLHFRIAVGTANVGYAGVIYETGLQTAVASHVGATDINQGSTGLTSCAAFSISSPLPGIELGSQSGCTSPTGTPTTFVGDIADIEIVCNAVGQSAIELVGLDQDPLFGTTTLAPDGSAIPTELNPQIPNPAPPPATIAAAGFACVDSVDVGVAKTGPATAAIGDTGTYTLNITQALGAPGQTVNVTDNVPAGATVTSVDNGPACSNVGNAVSCTGLAVPATVNIGVTFGDCGKITNTASITLNDPSPPSRVDVNPANNTSSAVTQVACPTVTKTPSATTVFTDDNVTFTITASGYSTTNPVAVTVSDPLGGGTFVVAGSSAGCTGTTTVTCTGNTSGGSITFTVIVHMPSTAGNVCDTATANPGNASSTQVCVSVKNKFPTINGIAKDTGVTPVNADGSLNNNFTFTLGNMFLCKDQVTGAFGGNPAGGLPPLGAFSGAGQTACNQFTISEVAQAPLDKDTCNDDDDHDGAGCAGDPSQPPAPYQDAHDGCLNIATDYISGVTKVDCNGGEVGEGLGAFEFQVKFDDKIFSHASFTCGSLLGSSGRTVQPTVSVITENWVQFGCVSKNPQNPVVVTNGPDISQGGVLGQLTLTVESDMVSRLRPAKDNGVVTNLLDENCELADTLGQPYNLGLGTFGENEAPDGGHTQDCKDAALTIRMLEGDVNLDCQVTVADDQMEAQRYGQFFGELLYNRFFDLEPQVGPDFDIDIKDLQTVFGRNGSTCSAPIPTQAPNPSTPDP